MRRAGIILLVLSLLYAISCDNDLDVAPWKEISIVYGVINLKDTAQYLRINRVYSSPDCDPGIYAQANDSVNYSQDMFDVFLEEYRDGEMVGETIEYVPVDREKEPGLFSSESNCVFKTNKRIDKHCEYKLRVINKESGHETNGLIEVVGGVDYEDAFNWERAFYRVNYTAEKVHWYEGSLDPQDHEHYIVRFIYWEYINGVTYYKYVDWLPSMNDLKTTADDDTAYQMFDAYYEYLAENIELDPSVKRRARGVDYMLALPGKELQNYIQVHEQPTNPHFYPDYSNMTDGYGVFGSKYFYTYFGLKLKPKTIDTISWGRHLINHRFSDSNGEWH
ncbi:MAG: hypothetical protein ABFS05_05230 [Bacteroidota bacterium]